MQSPMLGTLQMTIYITHENDASAASEFLCYNWMLLNSNLTLSLIFFQYLGSLERNQSPDHFMSSAILIQILVFYLFIYFLTLPL